MHMFLFLTLYCLFSIAPCKSDFLDDSEEIAIQTIQTFFSSKLDTYNQNMASVVSEQVPKAHSNRIKNETMNYLDKSLKSSILKETHSIVKRSLEQAKLDLASNTSFLSTESERRKYKTLAAKKVTQDILDKANQVAGTHVKNWVQFHHSKYQDYAFKTGQTDLIQKRGWIDDLNGRKYAARLAGVGIMLFLGYLLVGGMRPLLSIVAQMLTMFASWEIASLIVEAITSLFFFL